MFERRDVEHVDVTPSPRILRTLGEIPFEPWQCFAELIDNSIDAFQYAESVGIPLSKRQIIVSWTSVPALPSERKIEVRDTGPGMTLEAITNAVRAGFSSKTAMDSLGLFGMGFNIATARLGEKTTFLSTRMGEPEWVGVQIDFDSMIRNQNYEVPVVRYDKSNPSDHGARVMIEKLKPGIYERLRSTESQIRDTLSDVYSPLLRSMEDLELLVQTKRCKPQPYCIWSESRYVIRNGEKIPAVLYIDEKVGSALFNVNKNRYLSFEEEEEAYKYQEERRFLPDGIVEREKRICGWLGIQRFGDPTFFGIDFVRNGRKILRKDKSLFSYYIHETGTQKLEYPMELASTWGGRIVGEIHVDHLVPTYQKNDFDRGDRSWFEMINVLRGDGPILPKMRAELNYQGQNTSPLGYLVRGYGRMEPGTKWLAIRSDISREWAKKFFAGDPDYQPDDKWWEAAQQADMDRADKKFSGRGVVNQGSSPSDSPDQYGPEVHIPSDISHREEEAEIHSEKTGNSNGSVASEQALINDLMSRSTRDVMLSREYRYKNCPSPLEVEVRRLTSGVIRSGTEGEPVFWDKASFRALKFFYNPSHPFFMTRKTQPHEILLLHLAETFIIRDRLDKDLTSLYIELLEEMFPNERIDLGTIQEKAHAFFDRMRTSVLDLLSSRESEVLDMLHELSGDLEDTMKNLVSNPDLQLKVQHRAPGGIKALMFAPERVLVRLISKFPEEFFDGKFFRVNYTTIQLSSPQATERIREEAKERVISYVKDALWILSPSIVTHRGGSKKEELLRCNHSLDLLEEVLAE